MKIYCISLAGSPRRERAKGELEKTGLPYEIIDAVDGRGGWCDEIPHIEDRWGGGLLPTEAACYYSHMKVLRRIMAEGLHSAIVTEDDFKVLRDGWASVIPAADTVVPGWDHIQLHGIARDWEDRYRRTGEQAGRFHRVVSTTLITSSYAISRQLAKLVLRLYPEAKIPIDHLYAEIGAFDKFHFYDLEHPIADLQILDSEVSPGRTLENHDP